MALLLGLGIVLSIRRARARPDVVRGPAQRWQELAPIPDALGVAGPFVGASGGALLLAGGANFPDNPPWEGGAKRWCDAVYALAAPRAKEWTLVGHLPKRLGYGVSASWRGRLLCVGGSDSTAHHRTVLALRYRAGSGTLEEEHGPPLPVPLANAVGVLVHDVLYVACGSTSPQATEASSALWRLDLTNGLSGAEWEELADCPGPGRVLPAIGWSSHSQQLLLVSGAKLLPTADGKGVTREFLRDAFAFSPAAGTWRALQPPPRAIVASPGPAIHVAHARPTGGTTTTVGGASTTGGGVHLFLPGDDGAHFFEQAALKDRHPGFGTLLMRYHESEDRWSTEEAGAEAFPQGASTMAYVFKQSCTFYSCNEPVGVIVSFVE